jgi:hypothetical protein
MFHIALLRERFFYKTAIVFLERTVSLRPVPRHNKLHLSHSKTLSLFVSVLCSQ